MIPYTHLDEPHPARYTGHCRLCEFEYKPGHLIGSLLGIHGIVCYRCWWFFQLL